MDCNFPSRVVQKGPSKLRTGGGMVVFKVGFVLFVWVFFLLTRLHECHKTTTKKNEGILGYNGW